MKTKPCFLLIVLALIAGVHQSAAQGARFFRISGPAATTIMAIRANGTLVWSNALAGTNYTVQTVSSLPGGTNWVDYVQLPVTNSVNTNLIFALNPPAGMAFIPAGSFVMGDTLNDWPPEYGENPEIPLHTVNVSAFYMDKYDVTKALWDEVYSWAIITHGYSFEHGAQGKAANHPAQSMTWYDAVKWCNARSEKENKVPAYYTDAGLSVRYRSGQVAPYVNWGSGYRLPTEAEWEKAARGGASGRRFPWGNTISWSQANYYAFPSSAAYDVNPTEGYHPTFATGNDSYTSPVGYFAPNGYGLYDMAGNVGEWCWDWYGAYSSGSQTDPRGAASGSGRVLRGGSWSIYAFYCRTAFRNGDGYPAGTSSGIGFRSVLPPGQ